VTTRINVDRDVCMRHGECSALAPETFSFDVAGNLTYRSEVGAAEGNAAEDAAFLCPTQAITVTHGPGPASS
jgi:ferredoxin